VLKATGPGLASVNFTYIVCMANSKSSRKARLLSSHEAYRGPAFWVTTDEVLEPSGIRVRRDVVRHTGSVVVLAVDKESRVLLERQYRHAAGRFLYELPAGRIDKGENALAAGKRELLEETGYTGASGSGYYASGPVRDLWRRPCLCSWPVICGRGLPSRKMMKPLKSSLWP